MKETERVGTQGEEQGESETELYDEAFYITQLILDFI